ncbi:ATP-dependent endonuclease [Pseudarthrobacter sp. NPDC058119]|uniref:ATP-dependent nuclease n=1 Tax=Pseudarthrobacter sp. NPDC058119 TaxID=3346348 RepID=UPI0036D9E076
MLEGAVPSEGPNWVEILGVEIGNAERARVRLRSLSIGGNAPLKLDPFGITAIVGSNNSGKSTLLRQLRDVLAAGPQALQNFPHKMATGVQINSVGSSADFLAWLTENAHYAEALPGQYGRGIFRYGHHSVEVLNAEAQWNGLNNAQSLGALAPIFSFSANGDNRFQYAQPAPARAEGSDPPSEPLHHLQDDRDLFRKLSELSQRVFNQPLTLDDSGSSLRIRMGRSAVTVPRLDESRREYAKALAQLPSLDVQGDGVRAFFSLFVPLMAATYAIVIVDEPEAFLHPPQAFAAGKAMGEIAKLSEVQVILATHDKDFLAGVLASNAPLRIARLQRNGSDVVVRDVAASALQDLWQERLLRYSNVLSGLFHRLVVICEGEQDCHFYQAALEDYLESRADTDPVPLAASDVLFVPTNGKAAMAQVAGIVSAAGVPTVIVPDLDVLDDKTIISRMVTTLSGDWERYAADFMATTTPIERRNAPPKVQALKDDLDGYLDEVLDADSDAVLDQDHKEKIDRILRTSESDWALVKVAGISVFRGNQRQAADRLLKELAALGIVPLEVGSLESFAPTFAKNRRWLPRALETGAHRSAQARSLVERILQGCFY